MSIFLVGLIIGCSFWIIDLLINGIGYAPISEIALLILGLATVLPIGIILVSPKGELQVDESFEGLVFTFTSKNIYFNRNHRQSLVLTKGEDFVLKSYALNLNTEVYTLTNSYDSIEWRVIRDNPYFKQALITMFNQLSVEPITIENLRKPLIIKSNYAQDVELEPIKKMDNRNRIRKTGLRLILTIILLVIISQFVQELRFAMWKHHAHNQTLELKSMVEYSEIELNSLLDE